jgi:hypothetical protein
MNKGKTIELYDAYLVAFLSLQDFEFNVKNRNGTIYFEFELSDTLNHAVKQFQETAFFRYSAELKRLRGLIRAYR